MNQKNNSFSIVRCILINNLKISVKNIFFRIFF